MTFSLLALAVVLQGAPAASAQTPAKGSISGIVLHNATGDPIPNVGVTLAKVDASPVTIGLLRELIGQDPEGAPQREITLPAAMLEVMALEMGLGQQDLAQAGANNKDAPIPPEMALLARLNIEDIQSLMVDPAGKLTVISKSTPPIATDGAGRFSFQNLEPGVYRLIFAANGYVRQEYGQRGSSAGVPLLLEAGKSIEGLATRLTPTGTISGRVTDNTGQPLAAINVQLSRYTYDATGRKKIQPTLSARTNDRGEYRFYYLTPGHYFVTAGSNGIARNPGGGYDFGEYGGEYGGYSEALLAAQGGGRISTNRIADQRYALVYYPGTPNSSSATPIDVTAGAHLSDIDFALAGQGAFTVRGRIIDPSGGGSPQSASVRLTSVDGGATVAMGRGQSFNPADGTFELRDVPNGSYVIAVDLPNRNPQARLQPPGDRRTLSEADQRAFAEAQEAAVMAEQAARPRAFLPITVANADLDGLLLTPTAGGLLSGRLRIESRVAGKPAPLERIGVEFRAASADGAPGERNSPAQPQPFRQPKADGTFRLINVYPGEYWLRLRGLPPGYYIQSARLGDADALNHALALPASEASLILDIVISANVGQIDGLAATAEGRPIPGAQVVLVPDRYRERTELFRPVNADASGHFSIADVEPGEYHLAAWPFLDPFAFFDPDLIKLAQEKGTALRVGELSKQTVTVEPVVAPEAP